MVESRRGGSSSRVATAWVAAICGCAPSVLVPGADGTGSSDGSGTAGSVSVTVGTSQGPDGSADATFTETGIIDDFGSAPDVGSGCTDCSEVDVLFVIDNSSSMAEEQLALARAGVQWIADLEDPQLSLSHPSIHVMVTTTDMDNPLCTAFQPPQYEPAMGVPITSGCNARIADFTGLGTDPLQVPEVCTSVCPSDVVSDAPFLAFGGEDSNIPEVPEVDVDGDGVLDSAAAQALACLLPQGINGCGYESPLEAMAQALRPDAPWNLGPDGFLRDSASLVIVILTDESDCSIEDPSLMQNPLYWNTNPASGMQGPSSALCWNAGVECVGPDASFEYADCVASEGNGLFDVSRYQNLLVDGLVGVAGKRVDMLAIHGVPPVTSHASNPPYEPTAGGFEDLVIRDWRDGAYPMGDLSPADLADGLDAADKAFLFGIGPACIGATAEEVTSQALPNPRLVEVCRALDDDATHCFIESVCSPDYDGAAAVLYGLTAVDMNGGFGVTAPPS